MHRSLEFNPGNGWIQPKEPLNSMKVMAYEVAPDLHFLEIKAPNFYNCLTGPQCGIGRTGLGAKLPGFKSQFSHLPALWSRANYLKSQCLDFNICKMWIS